MSEILFDSLVRSVESLEKKTDKLQDQVNGLPDYGKFHKIVADRLDATENDIKELPGKIFMPLPEILGLTRELQHHSRLLSLPTKQEVRHEHHINKSVIVIVVLSLVIVGLLFLIYYTWFEAEQHKDNDIKYRYMRVFTDLKGLKTFRKVDSLYNADPAEFRDQVVKQEKIELEKFEDDQQVQKNQEEIKKLQERWKQK